MDIEGLRTYADLKFIEIFVETKPYNALLGFDYAIDSQTIINFKKMILSFKDSKIRVVVPIDLLEGKRDVEHVHSEGKYNCVDQLYNIMSSKEDYINSTTDGKLSWRSVSS